MTTRLLAVVLGVSLAAVAVRAQDHPFKNVSLNDFATYKMKLTVGSLNLEGTTTQVVTAKTNTKVTLKITANFSGMETPPQDQEIDLTKPYDPIGTLSPGAKASIKKLKEGQEKIKSGKDKDGKDKEYDCTWTTYQIDAEASGHKITGELKVWESRTAKLGLVKMEMSGKATSIADPKVVVDTKMSLEMMEDGTKKP